jgi:hypothetical protein
MPAGPDVIATFMPRLWISPSLVGPCAAAIRRVIVAPRLLVQASAGGVAARRREAMRSVLLLWGLLIVSCSVTSMTKPDTGPPTTDTGPSTTDTGPAVADANPNATDAPRDSPLVLDAVLCPLKYLTPGCHGEAVPVCDDGHGGACGGVVCDCQGKLHVTYYDRSDVPYAYRSTGGLPTADASDSCDPNAGAADAASAH